MRVKKQEKEFSMLKKRTHQGDPSSPPHHHKTDALALSKLPSAEMYERSYMHKEAVSHSKILMA